MEYEILTNTLNLSHKDWLQFRKSGIGGSDAGAILGVNKYRSPLEVYLDKVNKDDVSHDETINEPAYWGTVLEDIVAKEFQKRTGKKVRRKNAMMRSRTNPFMIANIDREIVGENSTLECKTASEYLKNEWKDDEIPASYLIQCQHYMAVSGTDKTYIAVLIGGNKFYYKEIPRDNDLINQIIEKEKIFWNNFILKEIPPASTGASNELLQRLYPEGMDDSEINLDNKYNTDLDMLIQLKVHKKLIEDETKKIESKLKGLLKENTSAFTDRYRITWKNFKSSRIDGTKLKNNYPQIYKNCLKTSNSRRFNLKEIEGEI